MNPVEDDIPRAVRDRFHDLRQELQPWVAGTSENRLVIEEVVRPALQRLEMTQRDDRLRADSNYGLINADVGKVRDELASFKTDVAQDLSDTREKLTTALTAAQTKLSHEIAKSADASNKRANAQLFTLLVLAAGVVINLILNAQQGAPT